MRDKSAYAQSTLASIAGGQYGVVTIAQLRAAGLAPSTVSRWTRQGRLHQVHRGVYALGHRAPSLRGRFVAAALACGEGAVVSHVSAAELWELLRPGGGDVHVSVPTQTGRRRQGGIRIHRCPELARPDLVTRRYRIPVTTPARTIADLEGTVEPYLLRRAIRQGELKGHRLGTGVTVHRTRSDLELEFLALCARHDLPRPEVNARIGRFEVDFLWRDARLVVETDSWKYHRGSVAFEDDHDRDLAQRQAGYEVRRFTGDQLELRPEAVAADLREALGRAS